MKNSGFRTAALAAIATAGVATLAFVVPQSASAAEYEHASHRGHQHHHRRGGAMKDPLLQALRRLHLTQEQREKVHALLSGVRKQHAEPMKTAREDFAALANPGDPGHAAAVQAAQARAASRVQRRSDLDTQIYALLTPEQKTKLPEVLSRMQAMRGHGHGRMHHRPAA